MDEKSDVNRMDEVMLPGFRFHPTDEELVGFYLRRKINQKPLSIELIKQLDIYKFDPWDLPKMATTGEKEWYFYCPRDRKYRNSARPNRVTCAGFWKATGTDRPIYSSEGTKCIGLKKSLVFYKGRAAKGFKTDWMMHEFRLPSLLDSTQHKKPMDKNIPANDSWAICRIFKKNNSMAQRALFHSWASPLPETTGLDIFSNTQFSSENISCTTEAGSGIQFCSNNDLPQTSATDFPTLNILSYKAINPAVTKQTLPPISNGEPPPSFMLSPLDMSIPAKSTFDVRAMLLNLSPTIIGDISRGSASIDFSQPQQSNSFSVNLQQDILGRTENGEEGTCLSKNIESSHANNQWGAARTIGFPFNLPANLSDTWKFNLSWDSPSCPSEMPTSYSTNKCYT